jgi:outer membrane protein
MKRIFSNRATPLVLATLVGCFARAAFAEPLDEQRAVEHTAEHNPDLRAALLELRAAQQAVTAAEAQYTPTIRIKPGATHSERPIATSQGITTNSSDAVDIGVGVSHRFSWGTEVSLDLDGSGSVRRANRELGTTDTVEIPTNYGLKANLGITQPLLKNAGDDVGEAELRMARSRKRGAEYTRDRVASELLRDVLSGYWQLWYSESELQVYIRDRQLAQIQYEEAQQRADLGTLATTDTLSFATQLASLEETLEQAKTDHQGDAVELGRLLGLDPARATNFEIAAPAQVPLVGITREHAAERARKVSQELREIEAEIEVAREQVTIADDASQARLDLDGYVSAEGLGERNAIDPLEQVGTLSAVSAYVGLTFEFPVSNQQLQSQLAKARLALEASQARLEARVRQIEATAANQVDQLRAASQRVALAQRTVEVATQLAQAERERFEIGTTTPLQVLQAQEDLRSAELRFARAKVDQAKATFALLHLTADLLPRYASLQKGLRGASQ